MGNHVKSKPYFSDNRTPNRFWGRGYDLDTKVCLLCPFFVFQARRKHKKSYNTLIL